jgi:hypothetical protein
MLKIETIIKAFCLLICCVITIFKPEKGGLWSLRSHITNSLIKIKWLISELKCEWVVQFWSNDLSATESNVKKKIWSHKISIRKHNNFVNLENILTAAQDRITC